MSTKIRFIILGLILFSGALFADDPSYYVRKSTWNETMRASREALMKLRSGDAANAQSVLGPWYAIGPFKATGKSAFSEAFGPEKEIDLAKSYKDGTLKWEKKTDWPDGKVIDLGPETVCAIYLFRTITVERDTILLVSLGSDDGIQVWLNGTEILANNTDRGTAPDQERIDLVLKKGENKFLMKINNNSGGFGYYFRLDDAGVNTIWKLVRRDFIGARSTREMNWEIEDGIWDKEWKPGAWGELAARYLHAAMFDTQGELVRALTVVDRAKTAEDLVHIRDLYIRTRLANSAPYILTPEPSSKPRINGAKIFGARPGSPFLYTVAATGVRPMEFSAEGLPAGLSLDKNTGRITGAVNNKGTYAVNLTAENSLGRANALLRIVIGDQIALTPPMGWNS